MGMLTAEALSSPIKGCCRGQEGSWLEGEGSGVRAAQLESIPCLMKAAEESSAGVAAGSCVGPGFESPGICCP